jgi:mycothiol synthase
MSASPPLSPPDSPWLLELIARARATDGQPPFSDQSLIDLRLGERDLLAIDGIAAAIVSPTEAELVVDPDARGRGHGTALLSTVIDRAAALRQAQGKPQAQEPPLLIWAHGDHAAARALAARFGFEPVRRLLQLRADVSASDVSTGSTTDYFRPGTDDAAWLALNARAFASHPEQGSVAQKDLDAIMAEPWFDPSTFLVLRDGDAMVGYCWLKVDRPSTGSGTAVGELYVVGVDPDHQREGLGRRLVAAGLSRLRELGIRSASLYVEADNVGAVKLYESFGFSQYSIDIQYAMGDS